MNRISSQLNEIKSHYTAIVIGSGYGGGIAASRLARAGQSVCVLERGKEYLPGDFPDTLRKAREETQIDLPKHHMGLATALFDFRVNDDIHVLVGCGLGGTSLINANVVIKADPRVFEDPAWPNELVGDIDKGLAQGYELAREMLSPQPYPDSPPYPKLKKLDAMEKSARAMGEKFYRPDIAVTFKEYKDGVNHVGVPQTPCINCGDCFSGCNHTSKNTVHMNYLPDAWNHGAEIFTEASVQYISKKGNRWWVHYTLVGKENESFTAPAIAVSAEIVILAAGSLGSTEILLRSRERGLNLSNKLGENFSGNGDVLGFGYNTDQKINGVGLGHRVPDDKAPVGPTITGIIDTRASADNYKDGMCIEEGAVPGMVSSLLPWKLFLLASFFGKDTDRGLIDFIRESARKLVSIIKGPYFGAVANTQTYLVMTHDGSDGIMELNYDKLRIKWPDVGRLPIFKQVKKRLTQATKALGGTFIPNPIWSKLFGHNLITVHPLGGCPLADDASSGVVNHEGQVFDTSNGNDTLHEGLYVMDGAVIPTSIGTNPLLTISAIAERNIARLAKKRGWTIDYKLPSQPREKDSTSKAWSPIN